MSTPEYVWYKWFPAKALSSIRFQSLTLEQEGFYRRLYDLASLSSPSEKRGWLYNHGAPATLTEVFHMLRTHHSKGHALIKHLADKGLITQDENGAWGFLNFAKHQRGSNLRVRKDGLGSAEAGSKSDQNRIKNGSPEAESRKHIPKEAQHNKVVPCAESLILQMGLQGVGREQAISLAGQYGSEVCEHQLNWLPLRKPKHPAAMLVKAIRENWEEPVKEAKPEKTREDIEFDEKFGPSLDRAAAAYRGCEVGDL